MKILLITGLPGMGKTTIGNYLSQNHGFLHLDMEDRTWPREFEHLNTFPIQAGEIMRLIKKMNKDTVLTWGFDPFGNRAEIQELMNSGATIIWLEGNRNSAYKSWKKGKGKDLPDTPFYIQLDRIGSSNIKNLLKPIFYDTFNGAGEHKSPEQIITDLLELIK